MGGALRILFITSWYPSRKHVYAGAFVREQALALAGEHDVRVIAPHLGRRPGWLARSDSSLDDREPAVSRPNASFLLPRRLTWADAAGSFMRSVRESALRWRHDGWLPDVIFGHTLLPAGWSAVQLGRELDRPVIVTIHSSFASQRVLTRSSDSYVRHAIGSVDRLVAVGPTIVEELRTIEPRCQPVLIPNLVDDEFFTPGPRRERGTDEALRIVGAGNLIAAKRYDMLLRAMARLRDTGTATRLTLIGDGPERKRLESHAARLRLAKWVVFTGAQGRDGVRAVLRDADVLVHPSRTETFGVVLIEAMACGVPVIAARSGGPDWIVQPGTGVLFDIDDDAALQAALRSHAYDLVAYDREAIRASVVRRFGQREVTGQLVGLFREAIAGAGAPS